MRDLRQIEHDILAKGRVGGPELEVLRRQLYAGGTICRREAAWLRWMLCADGKIDDEGRKFLHELRGEAERVSREFEALFAESMKQPPEQRTCG